MGAEVQAAGALLLLAHVSGVRMIRVLGRPRSRAAAANSGMRSTPEIRQPWVAARMSAAPGDVPAQGIRSPSPPHGKLGSDPNFSAGGDPSG